MKNRIKMRIVQRCKSNYIPNCPGCPRISNHSKTVPARGAAKPATYQTKPIGIYMQNKPLPYSSQSKPRYLNHVIKDKLIRRPPRWPPNRRATLPTINVDTGKQALHIPCTRPARRSWPH